MPTRIDATFQNAQSITLDAFSPAAHAAETFRNATIKVGKDAFRVSFAGDGNVSVSFATTSFFHLFQGSRKTAVRDRIQELVALHAQASLPSLTASIAKAVSTTAFRDNVERTMREETRNISRTADGKLAHYGFSDVRIQAAGILDKASVGRDGTYIMTPQLINDYNTSIGLGEDTHVATTLAFVRDNNLGTWRYAPIEGVRNGIRGEDQAEWIGFLKGHDLDLFSKVRQARTEAADGKKTGWAGEIARQGLKGAVLDLVRKNLDPRAIQPNPDVNLVLNAVADAVIETVDADFTGLDERGITARLKEIVGRHAPRGREALAWDMFDNAATTAFWRQTSKRGLDFFKARGETVVFEWTTFNGAKSDGTELTDKWWKRPDEDVRDRFGVAVTNSEMRHLKGAKYAAQPGAGRVVKIEGALSQAEAEQIVQAKVDRFKALPEADLRRIVADLKAGFAEMDATTFHDAARHALASLPQGVYLNYMMNNGTFEGRDIRPMIESAFRRLSEKLAATTSLVAQATLLSSLSEAFEAELLADPKIVDDLASLRQSGEAEEVSARTRNERTLAGLDHGRGGEVFFAPDTGRPNALGDLLLGDGGDVKGLVDELRKKFAEKMGIQPDEALSHPAFKTFLPRAALAARGGVDDLIKALDTVKLASDARAALVARGALSLPAERLFARRGDWDLNRLIFNEAVAAKAAGRDVDLDSLVRNADGLRTICRSVQDFVANVAQQVNPDDREGLRLTDAERDRLEDAYLDRENSSVVAYRRSGREAYAQEVDGEARTTLRRTTAFVAALRENAGGLPDETFKSLVIDAVATRAKPVHGKIAVALLAAVRDGGPIPLNSGKTAVERLRNFARALADRIGPAWRDTTRAAAAEMAAADGAWGHDDGNTSMRMFFMAYLKANPNVKAFLDRTLDGEAVAGVMDYDRSALEAGDPLPHVLEAIATHGQL